MLAFVIVFFPVKEKETPFQEMEFSQISAIAELTTTINYYHDVVEIRDDPDLIFKFGLFRYGYKRLWMEYSGEVRMGVDASKIKVKNPDANNVVEIFVPKAEVLSAKVNHESLSEPIFETGWFTTITAEEKAEAVKLSQLNMEEKAKNDYETSEFQKVQPLEEDDLDYLIDSLNDDIDGGDYDDDFDFIEVERPREISDEELARITDVDVAGLDENPKKEHKFKKSLDLDEEEEKPKPKRKSKTNTSKKVNKIKKEPKTEEIDYEDFSDDFFDDGVFGDEGYESLLDDYVEKPKAKAKPKSKSKTFILFFPSYR